MFGQKQQAQIMPEDYEKNIRDLEHKQQLALAEMESNHKLALKEKEFELKHFKDDETKKLSDELAEAKKNIAVLEKENEMLGKITNLNADIIDIKDLVVNLINKLPEIKLNNLTIQNENIK